MAEALGVAASVIAVVDMSAKVLNLCGRYARDVKNAKDDIRTLNTEVVGFQTTTQHLQSLLEGPRGEALETSQDVCGAIKDAHSTFTALAQKLEPSTRRKAMSRVGMGALKWPFKKKDVEETIEKLARSRGTILLALNVDQTVLMQNVDHKIVVDRLPIAEGASFDSHAEEHNPTCLTNTRVELLKDIYQWIEKADSKTIFWLNGMAGTGKSTIARTVARTRSDRGDLGGSFFFKRAEADRGNLVKFMSTLAHQLVVRMPGVAPHIKNAIDVDPGICGKTLGQQFEKLIHDPLSKAMEATSGPSRVVVVIDALDECERDEDIRLLISILSSATILRSHLRVLLTSRPELPIRLGFSQVRDRYQDSILHEIPSQIVAKDIQTYLWEEFRKIRQDFNASATDDRKLPLNWPGHESVAELTKMAVPLFIFAATLCRFINDSHCGSPETQLRKVQEHNKSNSGSQLDRTYRPILMSQLNERRSKRERDRIIQDFKLVVGAIVTLANPLSARCLALLLNIDRDVVDTRLDMLHSVLSVPSDDSPVRLLHLSFRDYLVDPDQEATNAFWVDERSAHQALAKNCLRVMAARLWKNMCGMSCPGMRRSAVDSQRIAEALPPELQYACRFWAHHWTAAEFAKDDGLAVYGFLKEHLLHWLEAMSLLGCVRQAIGIIRHTTSWIEDGACQPLSSFLTDAVRFVKANFSAIDETPLQLYSSALAFAPSGSVVRSTFEKCIPCWMSLKPKVEGAWDACLAVLEGHNDVVMSVVFSHDSKTLASASWDQTIRIWDVETGECRRVLKGHSDMVRSVVFSHDSKMLASASLDETARIWDVEKGELKEVLEGYDAAVSSVVFSHDSKTVALAPSDATVRIYDAATGEYREVLEGHRDPVSWVVFSHDSKMLASASSDKTIRVWDVETGECKLVLEGHIGRVYSVAFSHDSKTLASASWDETIRIWDVETGECRRVLKGHSDRVRSVVFSHDSKMLTSASSDETIRIWDVKTGECKLVLEGHNGGVISVVFSHDSKMLASTSSDKTVRIWDVKTGEFRGVRGGDDAAVSSVVFSHDSKTVASASPDKTVRVWDSATGECKRVLEGHNDGVGSVVFSHDSKMLASTSSDKTVRIWDAETGACRGVLEGHSRAVWSVVFSHDSKTLASSSADDTARIWDAATGECRGVLEGHRAPVWRVVFSQDSKMVVSSSLDETVRIWDAETGACRAVLEGHHGPVWSVVFSHDSKTVASASFDDTVRVWDSATGECRRVLKGHNDGVNSVVFSHDSKMLASTSSDKTIRIWDAETGECSQVVSTPSVCRIVSCSSNGYHLITSIGRICLTRAHGTDTQGITISSPLTMAGLGMREDSWVTVGGKDWLWLPAECRDGKMAVSATTVAIGCRSGKVVILGISVAGGLE